MQTLEIAQEKKEWKEQQEEVREEHKKDPILRYCNYIRGDKPAYDKSFEEYWRDLTVTLKYRKEILKEEE